MHSRPRRTKKGVLQAQLKPDRVEPLKKAVPQLSEEDIKIMKKVPFRSYDPSIVNEPLVYRMQEVGASSGLGFRNSACAVCNILRHVAAIVGVVYSM